jgi:hypothetical protein
VGWEVGGVNDWAEVELDRQMIAAAYVLGLVEWRDGGWCSTLKGDEVITAFCRRGLIEGAA